MGDMELVIDRKRWLQGSESHGVLVREDGCGCAIGLYLTVAGLSRESLIGAATPSDLPYESLPKSAIWLLDEERPSINSCDADQIMSTNDDDAPRIPDSERETKIAAVFARHGVRVRFVDEVSDAG